MANARAMATRLRMPPESSSRWAFCFRCLSVRLVRDPWPQYSRPLLLHAIGKQTSHAGQTFIKITSTHGKTPKVKMLLNRIVTFFKLLKDAEQLSSEQRWYRILSKALEKYLHGRLLQPPILIPQSG